MVGKDNNKVTVSCLEEQPCEAAQLGLGVILSFISGAVGAVASGWQSKSQMFGHVLGAGLGVHLMAEAKNGVFEMNMQSALASVAQEPWQLCSKFGGAALATCISYCSFPPTLDFAIVVSAFLAAVGAILTGSFSMPFEKNERMYQRVLSTKNTSGQQTTTEEPTQVSPMNMMDDAV
eukprot:gnl/MRDRNA2_/MRDRNA2_178085_c0_seq1.p1 gnl/MRDRNA2_/MRDRNA2_178085_c0~~gnl/MRDRNA2_/MRDRNA2_178085_c0_seq1.p1  ORF type:complete len:177 (+),score=34.15 gnl/MRDRNA2_/MRDRNA2_178085_c0_seq1:59-589(+)